MSKDLIRAFEEEQKGSSVDFISLALMSPETENPAQSLLSPLYNPPQCYKFPSCPSSLSSIIRKRGPPQYITYI